MRFFGSLIKSRAKEQNTLKKLVMSDEVSVIVPRTRYLKVSSWVDVGDVGKCVNHVNVRWRLVVRELMSG